MVMLRQWNSRSELWVTTLSMIRARGLSWIQRVRTSPSSSRSLALVAVKTFAPIIDSLLGAPFTTEHAGNRTVPLPVGELLTAAYLPCKEVFVMRHTNA